ncbi:MAG TPA: Sec-independent protein translocase protein TatB [Bradyrhizobium sp.]|jgi:sec-independent protein translocase protein TatB
MLDFSWSHILIVLIVALVVVGPKDLPRMMRIVGQWMGKARAMANEFRRSFDEMARQSELDELRKEIENLRSERPLATVEHDLHQSIVPDEMKSVTPAADPIEVEHSPEPRAGEFKIDDEPVPAGPTQP